MKIALCFIISYDHILNKEDTIETRKAETTDINKNITNKQYEG